MNGASWTAGWVALALLATSVRASEDEAWLQRATVPRETRPLLVLLVDTSAAMAATADVLPPYEPTRDYAVSGTEASCNPDRVYWRRGPGPAPGCGTDRWVGLTSPTETRGWQCAAGRGALDTTGVFVAARAAQWEPRAAGGHWRELRAGDDGAVECRADRGRHGSTTGAWFAADGTTGPTGPWQADPSREPLWDAPPLSDAYVFYTGNYLNYLASPERQSGTSYDSLRRRVGHAIRSTTELDIAVVRFSHDGLGGDDEARGGMIALAPSPLPAAAGEVESLLGSWTPDGPAPLAESLVEVARWLAGAPLGFGDGSQTAPGQPLPSAPGARVANETTRYRSPFTHACRPVAMVSVTAGRASADAGAAAAAGTLAGLDPMLDDCDTGCLVVVAGFLARGDLLPDLPGTQRADVRYVLPTTAEAGVLAAASAAGRPVTNLDDPLAIVNAVAHALQNDAAVGTVDRVSGAGLESSAHAAADTAIYYALSAANPFPPWAGNLRRYQLVPSTSPGSGAEVLGRDQAAVFDTGSGDLLGSSWSEWADRPDGSDVRAGGAAARIPDAATRRLYADLTLAPLTDGSNRVSPDNALLTRALLGLEPGDPTTPADVVEWVLGQDREQARARVGDPGLRPPRVLRYGPGDGALALLPTNDGLLHAIDADTGVERWAFLPRTLLPRLAESAVQGLRFTRTHGFDGPVALHLLDVNRDGRLIAADGDQAWAFAGLGRGGTGYYALDISERDTPRLMWSLTAAELPGFGQSWPAPVLARMRLDTSRQGTDFRVVVLAGGHDPAEDAVTAPPTSQGAALVIVEAGSGEILWRADAGSPQADLAVAGLRRSTPSAPRLLDTDGDGFHDRIYLLDAGGSLLRFDFHPGPDSQPEVAARQVASLGDDTDPLVAPRFQSSPDIVYVSRNGRDELALTLGSGWLSRPRSMTGTDRFYVVFDRLSGTAASQPVRQQDLIDISGMFPEVPPDAPGWMLRLDAHGPGEKTAGVSITFDHRLRFLSYQPRAPAAAAPCGPPVAVSRLYTLDVRSGRPLNFVDDEPVPDEEVPAQGLPPDLEIAFPPAAGRCEVGACSASPVGLLSGQSIPIDFANDPVKTSWRQLDANAE